MMRQSASLTAGSRDASSTGDQRAAHTPGRWPDPVHKEFLRLRRSDDFKYRSKKWLRKTARAAIAFSDHQNAPTDDATGQRSGLSP